MNKLQEDRSTPLRKLFALLVSLLAGLSSFFRLPLTHHLWMPSCYVFQAIRATGGTHLSERRSFWPFR
jgi:hypothetical protein